MLMTIEQYMRVLLLIDVFKEDENRINQEIYKIFGYEDKTNEEKEILIMDIYTKIKLNEDFVNRFEFNGIEYGFIPNLQNITTQECLDLERLLKEGKHLNKIASILYRPITKSFDEYYQIEPYESYSKYEKVMNDVDCVIIVGAIDFIKQLTVSLMKAATKNLINETR
jgi:hypothetical protein